MKIRNAFCLAFVPAALATGLAAVHSAHAAVWDTCNGEPVKWRSVLTVRQNTCSIPIGSTSQAAYHNGLFQWDNLVSEVDTMQTQPVADCSVGHGDGQNEIALVNRASIDSVNGRTISQYDACIPGIGTRSKIEADVMVANDLSMNQPSSITLLANGASTFVHEFGHFFGFDHRESNYAAMHTTPRPHTGGSTPATLFPDDTVGLNTLYGINLARPNMMPSAYSVSGTTVSLLQSGTISSACRGQQTDVRFYIGNSGPANAGTYSFRIRLSTSATSSSGTTAATFTHSLNAFSEGVYLLGFVVPNVVNGTYYVHIDLDTGGALTELSETDNTTRSGAVWSITC